MNPTAVADPNDANVTIGFDLAQTPYFIEIRGTFTLDNNDDVTSGNISSVKAFGYDGTTKGALAAKNESLSVNWADFAPFLVDNTGGGHQNAGDIVITGVEYHAGAGMLTLKAATGAFTDAFATSLKGGYTSGITYSIDGTTDVSLSGADIYSVQASNSDASVSKLNIVLTPQTNSLSTNGAAANLLDGNSSGPDTLTISGVTGIADTAAATVNASASSSSGGGSQGGGGTSTGGGTITFEVTVEALANNRGNVYSIRDVGTNTDLGQAPVLEFVPGYTYVFDVSDQSNAGHPLYISSSNHTGRNPLISLILSAQLMVLFVQLRLREQIMQV